MNRTALPPAAPFDPTSGAIPAELSALFARQQTWPLVVLVVGRSAERDGWGARAAIQLADLWAQRGRGIVLVDLGFERPSLHEALSVANGEGVADLFLFGASLSRILQAVPAHAFRFAPAGVFVDDAAGVLSHRGWDRIAAELDAGGSTLLAWTPADAPGLEALLARAGHAIALALPGDAPGIAAAVPHEATVFAWLTPPAEPLPGESPRSADAEPPLRPRRTAQVEVRTSVPPERPKRQPLPTEIPSSPEERIRFIRARVAENARAKDAVPTPFPSGSARAAPPPRETPVVAPMSRDRWLEEPPPIQRRKPRRVRPGVVVATVLMVAGAGAGAWFGWNWFLDQPRFARAAAPDPSLGTPALPAEGDQPGDAGAAYSVAIEAHQSLPVALERTRELRRAVSGVTFYVAPTPQNDVIWHRVLAGPAPDSAAAAELLARLYYDGHKTALDQWAIRRTVWAFNLGDFESRSDAEARARELEAQTIPVYILEIPQTEGSPGYRLYAGAFEAQAESDYMRELLAGAGLQPRLIRRIGRPVA